MKSRVHQYGGVVASVAGVLLFATTSIHAIINGSLDGNLHPSVGVVVVELNGQVFTPCSGNLIAPTVFVTAAHCAAAIQSAGVTQVWVSFEPHVDFATSQLIAGTLHPNPAFDANAPDPNDVAVITFATSVAGITPVDLPTPGLLDELNEQNGLKYQVFTVVGYGVHERTTGGGPPAFLRDLNRRFATSDLNALGPAVLHLSKSATGEDGGASMGDSGGPILLGTSNTVVAIVGLRATQGMYTGYRLDIPSARAFLSNFVVLPD